MLAVTGDFHGDFDRHVSYLRTKNGEGLGAGDYLLVGGDYGFIFYPVGTSEYIMQKRQLDELEALLPYTVLWVDGNHENFDILEEYPVEIWHGGKVHRIRRNIIHLMRGQVYDIDGVKLFSMGGAYSIDKYMRREGYSWWSRELPDSEEYKEAVKNLAAVGNKVDIILTHTAPREIIAKMGKYRDGHDAELTGFLEWVMYEVEYKRWFFGHWHIDEELTDKIRAVYFDVVPYNR